MLRIGNLLIKIKTFIKIIKIKKQYKELIKNQILLEKLERPNCSYNDYIKKNHLDFSMGAITNEK